MEIFNSLSYEEVNINQGIAALHPVDSVFRQVELSPLSPLFYPKICTLLSENHHTAEEIIIDDFDELSRKLDKTAIQESCSVRNVLKCRALAIALIDDKGEIDLNLVKKCIVLLRGNLYSLSPGHQHDVVRDQHILQVLDLLLEVKELSRLIRNMSRPISNRLAEGIIRDTLDLKEGDPIHDVHVKRACLAAWLTYLRQSLGSCFATAPSILIQQEQPHLFLRDLDEMMSTGRLRRTFGGVEYSVPMSVSWGNGDLKRPIVMQNKLQYNENKLWMSPGLITAMESVGILDVNAESKNKVHLLHNLIDQVLPKISGTKPIFITSAEEIIRVLLLQHHGLEQKDIDEFLQRPKSMVHGGLMLHVPRTSKHAGMKGDPCVAFLSDFTKAKTAFKILADSALLKAWEFTVASFSEIKASFARFNFYASLGVNYNDVGGIGECLYEIISRKVEQANVYLKEREEEYEGILAHVRYVETRIRQAGTEKEIEWLKVEYQSRKADLYHVEELKQIAYERAKKIAHLQEYIIQEYDKKFSDYFQEVYDPEIHEVATGPFDDSPAGFRLLYKHGRSNPSLWTPIFSIEDFVESLVSFFTITEQELASSPQMRGIESEFGLIITQLVGHVRSDRFLESALHRMAKAHGTSLIEDPLHNLDRVEKKPWVYTSGGSMSILVSAYFRNDEKPFEVARWVESENELLAFFIDTLRQLPTVITDPYLVNPDKSMLIHSPTHAFLLKPGYQLFREGWTSDIYSYSWIKHKIVEPARSFLKTLYVDEEMAAEIVQLLMQHVPHDFRPRFRQVFHHFPYNLSLPEFRSYIVNAVHTDRGLRGYFGPVISADDIDSIVYSSFPFTECDRARNILEEILGAVFDNKKTEQERLRIIVDKFCGRMSESKYISSKQLFDIAKTVCVLLLGKTRSRQNMDQKIIQELRKRSLAMPEPIIFADTNWVKDYFAFVVSPTTRELELWSVDYLGIHGRPVSYWKMWLNGSKHDPKWGIFSRPVEYFEK